MKVEKDIGDLYKVFQGDEIPVQSEEWDEFAIKLNRMRFYRFSFSNFNIYYGSLILVSFLFTTYMVTKTIFSEEPEKVTQSVILPMKVEDMDSLSKVIHEKTENTPIGKTKKHNNTAALSPKKETQSNGKLTDTATVGEKNELRSLSIDSVLTKVKNTKDSVITKQPVKKNKKVVQIVKQDTIVILDTLTRKKTKRK